MQPAEPLRPFRAVDGRLVERVHEAHAVRIHPQQAGVDGGSEDRPDIAPASEAAEEA